MKWCSYCETNKSLLEFSKNKHQVSGYNTVCRGCDSKRHKEYREKNRELMNEKASRYYKINRDNILEKSKIRYQKDPVKYLIKYTERQVRKIKATPSWANQEYINLFYKIAEEETKRTGRKVEVDHIVPLRGKTVCGLHVEHNLQLLFMEDNRKKGNKHFQADIRDY